jgi:hypothetical protein
MKFNINFLHYFLIFCFCAKLSISYYFKVKDMSFNGLEESPSEKDNNRQIFCIKTSNVFCNYDQEKGLEIQDISHLNKQDFEDRHLKLVSNENDVTYCPSYNNIINNVGVYIKAKKAAEPIQFLFPFWQIGKIKFNIDERTITTKFSIRDLEFIMPEKPSTKKGQQILSHQNTPSTPRSNNKLYINNSALVIKNPDQISVNKATNTQEYYAELIKLRGKCENNFKLVLQYKGDNFEQILNYFLITHLNSLRLINFNLSKIFIEITSNGGKSKKFQKNVEALERESDYRSNKLLSDIIRDIKDTPKVVEQLEFFNRMIYSRAADTFGYNIETIYYNQSTEVEDQNFIKISDLKILLIQLFNSYDSDYFEDNFKSENFERIKYLEIIGNGIGLNKVELNKHIGIQVSELNKKYIYKIPYYRIITTAHDSEEKVTIKFTTHEGKSKNLISIYDLYKEQLKKIQRQQVHPSTIPPRSVYFRYDSQKIISQKKQNTPQGVSRSITLGQNNKNTQIDKTSEQKLTKAKEKPLVDISLDITVNCYSSEQCKKLVSILNKLKYIGVNNMIYRFEKLKDLLLSFKGDADLSLLSYAKEIEKDCDLKCKAHLDYMIGKISELDGTKKASMLETFVRETVRVDYLKRINLKPDDK